MESSETGTRGIILLDETAGNVTIAYSSAEGGGDILYKQTAISPIGFGAVQTMRSGTNNDVSSTKQNINSQLVDDLLQRDDDQREPVRGDPQRRGGSFHHQNGQQDQRYTRRGDWLYDRGQQRQRFAGSRGDSRRQLPGFTDRHLLDLCGGKRLELHD